MSYLTKYGSFWGFIPQTTGRVFWVSPSASYTVEGRAYSASDNNDGLSPERALLTIAMAHTGCTAAANDVIVLLPGSHAPSASLALSKAGVTLMGLPSGRGNYKRNRATIAAVTGDQNANVTAADIEIAYLNWIPVTTKAAIDFSSAAHGLHIHNCYFDMNTPAASTSTLGIDALGAAGFVLIENCMFDSDGAQGPGVDMTATLDSEVRDCLFSLSGGTWATALTVGAATDRLLIRRNTFLCSGTAITAAIDGTGATLATGVTITDNRFSSLATVPIDNFDASEADISENYDCGVGGTDGGALITAIT